jgi:cellobiose phosphorylase
MTKYGHFSNNGKEFIITQPDTPTPWVNYISNGKYTGLISNTAGGFSFYKSPRDYRITRWRYNSLPMDRPGRYIILREKDSGEYWSPTWQPTLTNLDWYQCRHGVYYTIISSRYKGIETSILYFVPSDDLEIWETTIKNCSNRKRAFDIFAFCELCLGHALIDLINQPNDKHFNEAFFDRQNQIIYATKRYWIKSSVDSVKQANEEWDKYVFFTSSLAIKGWDSNKNNFIGKWRSEENPIAIENGSCFDTEITAGDAVAAIQSEIELAPDSEEKFSIMLGITEKKDFRTKSKMIVDKYKNAANVEKEFNNIKNTWTDYFSASNIDVPDKEMNIMVNVWNQYQNSVTFRFSRDASYYHGGLLFGRGFRDSCQDIMGPVIPKPKWVQKRIKEMCNFQFKDGSTFHLYFPLTKGGEKTGHSDDPLWLPFAIITYLKETADFSILDKEVKYFDGGEATILEHLFAAINFSLRNLTKRNLLKFGFGDWNDTLDYLGRKGKGETVWGSMLLGFILKETSELCQYLGLSQEYSMYCLKYNEIKNAINIYCWDGEWYIRGISDTGKIIGSSTNQEGSIFLNVQSWAVISGVADKVRAEKCMASVEKHLDTPKGPKILHPAYKTIDPSVGLVTRCAQGKKENGAIFNHAVSWAILAECLLGHGERAYDIYRKALPMNEITEIDKYETEPYVYSEYITSNDHPSFGQASHSWLTGSATWLLRVAIDYILGIKPTYRGILIDPCIPKDWEFYKVKRKFRGLNYEFTIYNPNKLNKGVKSISIYGNKLSGNIIDLSNEKIRNLLENKRAVKVEVILKS